MGEIQDGSGQAPRYTALCLPADELGRTPWAVWDRLAGRWVACAGGEVDLFFDRHGAQALIRRLRYLDEAGIQHS